MIKYYTPGELAERLGLSPKTLAGWRAAKPPKGPKWMKLGDATNAPVRYKSTDLAAWEAAQS